MSKEEKIVRNPFYDVSVPQNVNVAEFVTTKCAKFGNKPALICSKSGKILTFNQFIQNVQQIARWLKLQGVGQNEVVGMCLQSSIEYMRIMLAITSVDAVCATSNPAYTVDFSVMFKEIHIVEELEYSFSLTQLHYVIVDNKSKQKVETVCKKYTGIKKLFLSLWMDKSIKLIEMNSFSGNYSSSISEQITNLNVRFLFGSSGTTGPSKAVMLTTQNIIAFLCAFSHNYSLDGSMQMFCFKPSDTSLSVFPHFHIGGSVIGLMAALKEGATCVVLPTYTTKDFMKCIETYRPTLISAPPPVYVFLTKSPLAKNFKIPSLQNAIMAGAPVGEELVEEMCNKYSLNYMTEAYGMTEVNCSHIMPISDKSKNKHGSCGVVVANLLCKVVDMKNGRSLGPNEKGEICHKGAQVMAGYFNNETATNETIDVEGWLHTGDIGYYDEDNYFYVVDRIKELIKVKGYQVAPAELENIILSYPGVEDAAVVGVKNEYAGELPRAYVVKNPSCQFTAEDLKTYVAGRVISYKKLEGGVRFVDEIPKNPSGKILRRLLRDKARLEENIQSKL